MVESINSHKSYRCYSCGINLNWRRVETYEENGMVIFVGCPICGAAVSELEEEAIDIDEIFGAQNTKKEEVLMPPRPSCIYYCYSCVRYVPWNKVETVIRKGQIVLYRCPFCREEVIPEQTAATWLDQQELARLTGQKQEKYASNVRSFVFQLEGDPCPECSSWPFSFRAEIGYPLRCANCGASCIDILCAFCEHGTEGSAQSCCKTRHATKRVTFCFDFSTKRA